MEADELEKYMMKQATIEVEHARSWPAKILAFYVAINFGLVASLHALASRTQPVVAPDWAKVIISFPLVALLFWAVGLFRKNHLSYLRHRNIQIQFQIDNLEQYRKKLDLPEDWFSKNKISVLTRADGWGFYASMAVIVTLITLGGIWYGTKT